MDYTWLANVKAIMGANETAQDTLLAAKISEASRAIDRLVTGREDVADYFTSESVTDEILSSPKNPIIDSTGRLICWPHKPIITAVTALAWRANPLEGWKNVDLPYMMVAGGRAVKVWQSFDQEECQVKLSYTGGLGTLTVDSGGTVTNTLPLDLVELATVLAIRFYREAMSGLTDSIGIAELGTLVYTKALPVRVQESLSRFTRNMPW